ncbi:MAG: hypothetical protein U9N85_06915 [Bacteroidota bacterium]|nr:hypothetical protein [Bacteroidota bacterium]
MQSFQLLSLEYSLWFVPLCIILGLLYAFVLYRKDSQLSQIKPKIKWLLFGLRTISVSIIAFLLLGPFINSNGNFIEEPIIIFAQDNSESVLEVEDTSILSSKINETVNKLSENFKVVSYTYGESVKHGLNMNFSDKQTNIAELTEYIRSKYYNQNVGALVLSGDGIYNAGNNPLYVAESLNFPVYTLALGDTLEKTDQGINRVEYNKIVFLNDIYPIRVAIFAKKLKGKISQLKIYDNDKLIVQKNIKINSNDFYKTIEAETTADKAGIHRLKVQLRSLENEFSYTNNTKDILFEVIDSKQNILILADSPHPDISAIKSSLSKNKNFNIDYAGVGENKKPMSAYNLIILHQLPSNEHPVNKELRQIRHNNTPTLTILGTKSAIEQYNSKGKVLKIQKKAKNFDPARGRLNKDFSLFELNNDLSIFLEQSPPLQTPFGNYQNYTVKNVLLFKTVKGTKTKQPLFVFSSDMQGGAKHAVIAGEGIWRWKLYDYKLNQSHVLFDELIQKSCQFLSLKITKDRFRVMTENIISENVNVQFQAERYNKSYELVNEEPVSIRITDSAENTTEFRFAKTGKAYEFNAGKLLAGTYKWHAETKIDGKSVSKKGQIRIEQLNIEADRTQANHSLLNSISETTGGEMLKISDIEFLPEKLLNNQNIKPVIHTEKKSVKLFNYKVLFFILLGFMSLEWFIRKYSGLY